MLTPLDIENKKFSKQMMNGYSVSEVDDFLDELTADYEKLYKENSDLKEKLDVATNNLSQYKSIETTLQNTLFTLEIYHADMEVQNKIRNTPPTVMNKLQATEIQNGKLPKVIPSI